jgi:hypothetical protein
MQTKRVNTILKSPSGYVLKEINEMHSEACNMHSKPSLIKTVITDPGVIFFAYTTSK